MYVSRDTPRYRLWIENNIYHMWDSMYITLYTSTDKECYQLWLRHSDMWESLVNMIRKDY